MNKEAVVLLSGGVDSTTCLAYAINLFGVDNVLALSIFYGQKHQRELEQAALISRHFGVDWNVLPNLSNIMALSDCPLLAQNSGGIPHSSYADQLQEMGGQGTVPTYVPFRNGLLLSCAAAIALSVNASCVMYGPHKDDAAGRAYPDCTSEFVEAMNKAIFEGSGERLRLSTPLLYMNKAEVVKMGLHYKVPFELTWSCYEGGDKACGVCGTCLDRKAAFRANGIEDPIEYVEV